MKKIILLLTISIVHFFAFSQSVDWKELGSGVNALNADTMINIVFSDAQKNVYTGGFFKNASGKYYVAKWNGTSWNELGSGANALNANGYIRALCSDPQGNIYVTGGFRNASGKYYVAKWNGATWSELGSGANALNANGSIKALCSDSAGNIYAAGLFTHPTNGYCYVAKWNGTSWSELGTGINSLNAYNWIYSLHSDVVSNIYAAGLFRDSINYEPYVAKWNGTYWSELGTGTSALKANATIYSVITDKSGNVYAAGDFTNTGGKRYVARWNGTLWNDLGNLSADSAVQSMTIDSPGNLYVAGNFKNSSGNAYVAKWNGTTWSEVVGGGNTQLNANGIIRSVCVDIAGNLYAGGGFANSSGKYYVARYGGTTMGIKGISTVSPKIYLEPNPANGYITILKNEYDLNGSHIIIIDMLGRNLYEATVNNNANEFTIVVNDFKAGTYILFVQNGEEVRRMKFVKE